MSATPSANFSRPRTTSAAAVGLMPRRPGRFYSITKRAIDLLISVALLGLLFPVWLLVAVLIKLDSRGRVFFTNRVVGKDEVQFNLYKFRSMGPNSKGDEDCRDVRLNFTQGQATAVDAQGRPVYKTALVDEKRITRVGKFLRRTSL